MKNKEMIELLEGRIVALENELRETKRSMTMQIRAGFNQESYATYGIKYNELKEQLSSCNNRSTDLSRDLSEFKRVVDEDLTENNIYLQKLNGKQNQKLSVFYVFSRLLRGVNPWSDYNGSKNDKENN